VLIDLVLIDLVLIDLVLIDPVSARPGTRSGAWRSNTGSVVLAIVDIDGVTA